MKRYLKLAALCGLMGIGCQHYPEARCGWKFELLKPPIVVSAPNATAITTAASAGLVGIDHNTSMGTVPASVEASALMQGPRVAPFRVGTVGASDCGPPSSVGLAAGCNLDDLCRRMERVERQLSPTLSGPAPAIPMPK